MCWECAYGKAYVARKLGADFYDKYDNEGGAASPPTKQKGAQ
jgi:hypothetical protein